MSQPRAFHSYQDFEREVLRPANRIGLSLEEMVEDTAFDSDLESGDDPFSEMADRDR
jgi:hypothetical protein